MSERRGFTMLKVKISKAAGERLPRAFTLVELLVVIAIIALLMAILIPALSKARKQAQAVVCMSNLKQIGTAAHLYAEDWNGYVPAGTTISVAYPDKKPWFQGFMPYLGDKEKKEDYRDVKIFRCPSYPDKRQTICYVVNCFDFQNNSDYSGQGWGTHLPHKLTMYKRLSETIYLADNEDGWWREIIESLPEDQSTEQWKAASRCDIWNPNALASSDDEELTWGRRVARNRHRKGYNALFADGHTSWLSTAGEYHRGGLTIEQEIDLWRFRRR